MFESAELGHTIDRATFKKEVPKLRAELLAATAASDAGGVVQAVRAGCWGRWAGSWATRWGGALSAAASWQRTLRMGGRCRHSLL